ncbi:MAG: geranylgeranyl reductase, partial [Saprospiraceae bacterium]|nr:geranylgeranyl reductase [Saprospiraceae bacterium]
ERYLIPALEAEMMVSEDEFIKHKKKVRFDVDAMPQGYGWVFPKKNHLSIGIASEKRGNIGLKDAYKKYVTFLGLNNILKEEIHGFQIPIKSRKEFSGKKVILTGDAAGLADPLVAEGISNAMISGKLAAEAVIEGNLEWSEVEKVYNKKLRQEIVTQTKTSRLLSSLFYHHPRLRKYVLTRKGQRLTEYFTDVFSGVRRYPEGIPEILRSFGKAMF